MGYNQAVIGSTKPKRNHFWSCVCPGIQQINPVGDYLYLLGGVLVTLSQECVGSKYGVDSLGAEAKRRGGDQGIFRQTETQARKVDSGHSWPLSAG